MYKLIILLLCYIIFESCTHDPTFIMDVDPDPLDTMMVDTSMVDADCMSDDISFSDFIFPTLETFCISCHSGGYPSGGVSLDDYDAIFEHVESGRLIGSMNWESGFVNMPLGQPQLDDCILEKIESWINDGAQNN
ncbi:MAG: hypothetical protein HKN51_00035 [Saprospiraceae bacterium]|nr:hypothetical protein [Saprospiraceae bacterium]